MSDIRDRRRFENSIALVEAMVEHILVTLYMHSPVWIKIKNLPSYEVWIEHNETVVFQKWR